MAGFQLVVSHSHSLTSPGLFSFVFGQSRDIMVFIQRPSTHGVHLCCTRQGSPSHAGGDRAEVPEGRAAKVRTIQ